MREPEDIDDEEIAQGIILIAEIYRRLWPQQTKWKQGGERPLPATEQQVLMLLLADRDRDRGRDEMAEWLGLDESTVSKAVRELVRRGLLEDAGRHPVDSRRRVQRPTPAGHAELIRIVAKARPIALELIAERERFGPLWPF